MNHSLVRLCAGGIILALAMFVGCSERTPIERSTVGNPSKRTLHVPAEYPTIQAAINDADLGDTVLVAQGVYAGPGNRDIIFPIGSLILKSEAGPLETIVDCGGGSASFHGGFTILNGQDLIVIDGFTVRNAYIGSGGAVHITNASPTIRNCVFMNNTATVSGGAVWGKSASAEFRRCTFIGNVSVSGAAVFLNAGGTSIFADCLFAYNDSAQVIRVNRDEAMPGLYCCNIYGNPEGDWVDRIAGIELQGGNMSVNPMLCGDAVSGYRLQANSPCLPQFNDCGRLIGAIDELCN